MLGLSVFSKNPIFLQQLYFLLNFPLIVAISYAVCRSLGIDRLLAVCVGFAFAFTHFRIGEFFYTYLANYFVVPLSLLPSLWIMQGDFSLSPPDRDGSGRGGQSLRAALTSTKFAVGLILLMLTTVTDGYYAFFALLIVGFATGFRALCGDVRRSLSFAVSAIYIAAIVGTAIALSLPVTEYRNAHPLEASQDGIKSPHEAEVYSSSLKLLVAPPINHRLGAFASIGQHLLDTSNYARAFPFGGGTQVPLGTLPTVFLLCAGLLLCVPLTRWHRSLVRLGGQPIGDEVPFLWIVVVLSMFVLWCSVSGGVGTLIAFAYPVIRAYYRFPVFLIFLLYLGAAFSLTIALEALHGTKRLALRILIVAFACLAILDQVPHDPLGLGTREGIAARAGPFLADRDFVEQVEAVLPKGAMVYQYPYSQFLTDSKYYGWASYGHCRLSLHSRDLRWSNCATKDGPVDRWHTQIAALPIGELLTEIRAVGFAGFVVDEGVMPAEESVDVRRALIALTGEPPLESSEAKLAFWKLPAVSYRVEYNSAYTEAERVVVLDAGNIDFGDVSKVIDGAALANLLRDVHGRSLTFDKTENPGLFKGTALPQTPQGAD